MICKCKGCKRAYEGCHDRCTDYKAYRAILDKANEKKQDDREYRVYLSDTTRGDTGERLWKL